MPCKQTFALLALVLWGCGPGPCHSASHCKEVDGQAICDPGYVLRPTTTSKPLRCVEPKADVVINNETVDSLFTVSFTTAGAAPIAIATAFEVAESSEQRFAGALTAKQGEAMGIQLSAFSDGTLHEFTPIVTNFEAGDTFVMRYYYDLDNDAYSMGHVWE